MKIKLASLASLSNTQKETTSKNSTYTAISGCIWEFPIAKLIVFTDTELQETVAHGVNGFCPRWIDMFYERLAVL